MVINCLTVDLEDWYQTHLTSREDVDRLEDRVEYATYQLLELFDKYNAKATFFTLGWIAESKPGLIMELIDCGHEIATHGWSHRLVYKLGPKKFAEELSRSRKALEDVTSQPVIGHRAACWSVTEESRWALDILQEQGFAYDSSIFPTKNYLYGIPDAPRRAWRHDNGLLEIPPSTLRKFGRNLPIAGGFYLRTLPCWVLRYGIRSLNRDNEPAIIYIHPWEFDVKQPRNLDLPRLDKFIHYNGLKTTEPKFHKLLSEFNFDRIDRVFADHLKTPSTKHGLEKGPVTFRQHSPRQSVR